MLSCLPTCDVRDLIFSQFSIDCCQKCVCFRGSALASGPRWGAYSAPKHPAGQRWVTDRSCPDRRPCFHIHLPLATPICAKQYASLRKQTSPSELIHDLDVTTRLAATPGGDTSARKPIRLPSRLRQLERSVT